MVNKYRVIIVDDEPLARSELRQMLQGRHLDIEVVADVGSTAQAWALLQDDAAIDGLFLDINIQTESQRAGLDFALNLQRLSVKPWIIFITGYREYALEAYQSFPVSYLVKPIDDASLERNLSRIRSHCQPVRATSSKRLAIRHRISDGHGEKSFCIEFVDPAEILYIQKNNGVNSVKIGLACGTVLDGVNATLREWQNHGFFQVHRRNLVNLQQVRREMPRVGENTVYKIAFKNCAVELDVGPDYLPALNEALVRP
jgi:DNA-binding LytR/AlgR family response regulator